LARYVGYVERDDVHDPESFAAYCQQTMGVPYPVRRDLVVLKRRADENPRANWQTMVRVADWCNNNRKRFPQAYGVFSQVRYAWAAHYVPELDPVQQIDVGLEERISSALAQETDVEWRHRLMVATGPMREVVYSAWRQEVAHG
jgi:argininosuccinate lyase